MKTLLTLFVLFFSSSVVGEDISDFEIEGMSIGDSLLKVFTLEEIKSHEENYYNDNKYIPIYFDDIIKLETYEGIQFHYKYSDNEFNVVAIEGAIYFENLSEKCFNKMKKVNLEIENIFLNFEKNETGLKSHQQDPSGRSKSSSIYYNFKSGYVLMGCVNWDQDMKNKYGLVDNFRLGIYTSDFQNWIDYTAYK